MIKRFLIAFVLVVLVCGGLVGFNLFRTKAISDFFATRQMPTVTVSAVEVNPVVWTPQIEAIGTLSALNGVDVSVQTGGVVDKINFKANDVVEAGQLLVQIDDAVERADLQSAQASLERDRAQLERAERLRKTGVSSEANLDEARTAFAASESALARIQATIDLKAVEAPFTGTIGIPRVELGQYVQPAAVIATLQQLDTMRVDFTVPEQRIVDLKMGQGASFGLTEDDFAFNGRLTGIDPKVDSQTRLVSVRAEVQNPDATLRPGQFVRVRVELPAVEDVLAVPQTSVVTSLYGDYVYVVAEEEPQAQASGEAQAAEAAPAQPEAEAAAAAPAGEKRLIARQVFVEIGRRQGNQIEIVKGLERGQQIVTSGQNKLANNMPIAINNSVDPAAVALDVRGAQP